MKSSKIPPNYQKIIDDAWLGITTKDTTLFNPLDHIPAELEDTPHTYVLWLMQQPEYFSFICKEIMGIQLLPMQSLILKEMWQRKFPMLIASRGAGKAIRPDEPVLTSNGWRKIKNVQPGDKVYSSDGKLYNVNWNSGIQTNLNIYKITFRDGRSIECCEDHMWKVFDKNKNRHADKTVWSNVSTKQMYDWVRKNSKTSQLIKEYRYAIPLNNPIPYEYKKYKLHPYIIGVLLGCGCVTQKTTTITTIDVEIIEKINSLLPDGYVISNYKYSITYEIKRTDKTKPQFCKLLQEIGISSSNKFIPKEYLRGSLEQRMELLCGLNDVYGYSNGIEIQFYTISNNLSEDYLELVRSLGIACKHTNGNRYADYNKISLYTDKPVFSLSRKLGYLNHQNQYKFEKTFITNIEYVGKGDGCCISVDSPDHTYITKDYIVTHNSFLLALYTILRILLLPSRRVVICGSAFRQSKVVFNYMESIWYNAPLLRDICQQGDGPRHEPDMFRLHIGDSVALALPVGDGQKIRGQRANDIIADEFAAQSREVFENVIAGFAAVRSGPVDSVQKAAQNVILEKLGLNSLEKDGFGLDNQIILSGTAFYDFNHFAEYWKRWKSIIKSKGDYSRLSSIFGDDKVPDDFDWRDYSIIRIPYELLPRGFMDEAMVARSKATIHSGIYEMEFGAVFSNDSNGFFRRSLIESCVLSHENEITLPSGKVEFKAMLKGSPDKQYVYGIDPASEIDNFSIVILEHHNDHRRIVYAWTTNRKEHRERIKKGIVTETDFYSYCARKIRELMKIFPCGRIAMDSQGGGIAVSEALHDTDKIRVEEGELPIWPIINPNKPDPNTDGEPGQHIIEMINFSSAEWTSEANHGLRKDFEDKVCIFPFFDSVSLGMAKIADEKGDRLYDTLEDCYMEIEELKNELSTIVISQTLNGRDRWDTPEVKLPGNKKGRLRKDRYSSLLMANMVSRQMARNPEKYFITATGGWAGAASRGGDKQDYVGADWIARGLQGIYD